jgi:hypothetical protein
MEEEGTFRRTIRRTDTDFFHLDICKYGDMEIVLTANTIHAMYTVSSHQLRAGSPIFRDLLCQGSAFQEHTRLNHEQTPESGLNTDNTNRATRYQLQVSKDFDPTAFSIVLCILHARGQNLPESIHFDHLISIVAICDHYHCSALLKPWHGKWVDSWKESAKSPGYENWLFAAWVIGEDNIFQILTKKFAHQGVLSNNKFVIVVENEQERDVKYLTKFTPKVLIGINQQVPQDDTLRNTYADTLVIYIDAILEQRNAAEEKIIQACRDIYEKYSNDTTTNCRTAPHSIAGKLCDRYIFGELHLRFKAGRLLQADVFSIPSGISLNRVVAVLDKLSKATISDLKDARMQGYYHNACAVDITGLATTAQAAVNDIKSLRLATFGRK